MKSIILFFILSLILLFSCKKNINEHSKTYASFSGKLLNLNSTQLNIIGKEIRKNIKVTADGSFKDTLKITNIRNNDFNINGNPLTIYLKNGYNLKLTGDANDLESLKYSGVGADENNFFLAQFIYGQTVSKDAQNLFILEKKDFNKKISSLKKGLDSISEKYNTIDSSLINFTEKQNKKIFELLNYMYDTQHEGLKATSKAIENIKEGSISPVFKDLESYNGKKYSLKDFKGSYLFIDFWTVGYNQYFKELPLLNKLKNTYKNINYISVCTENKRSSGTWRYAKKKWKEKVQEQKLTGIQLFSGENNKFLKDYYVFSFPRIIIIDPTGKVVTSNAPKLDSSELNNLLKTINTK